MRVPASKKKNEEKMKFASIETDFRITYPRNGAKIPRTPVSVI